MKTAILERLAEFPNPRGKTLRGMLHFPASARKHPVPAVVLFHGFTGNRMESHMIFVKCSRALARAGIASLRFDFFGSGESDGDFRQMTLRGEIADAHSAVAFMRAQPEVDPERLGVLGLSLGGAVAATVAASIHARAAVLWSAVAHTARLRDLVEKSLKKIPGRPGAVELNGWELHPRLSEDVLKVEPVRHLARFKGPTLIIHPGEDDTVPVSHARDFYQAAGGETKEIVIVEGADHVFSAVAWEQEAIGRSVRWFGQYL